MYKKMLIWKESFELVIFVYKVTKNFPKEELFALTSQIRRSAISIPSNIAEGKGRKNDKSLAYFLSISLGSLFELRTQIEIAHQLNYIDKNILTEFNQGADSLSKMISTIIKKLKAKS